MTEPITRQAVRDAIRVLTHFYETDDVILSDTVREKFADAAANLDWLTRQADYRAIVPADNPDSVKRQRLAELEAEFEAAGGRGVELADEIDALRSELSEDGAIATCKHCGRTITHEDGAWVDPNATGDDAVWRETCDSHDTRTAEHEPEVSND